MILNVYHKYFLTALLFVAGNMSAGAQLPVYRQIAASVEDRAADLLKQLSQDEKIGLLGYNSKPVQRVGIPSYNWWNEALHGVARAGKATVFPQAIGLAATFNDELIFRVADAISTEARAKYNEAVKINNRVQYTGLTFWSPNINIFRDPRWGRGQETYGEDPYLTGVIGQAFVKGMQGSDQRYLKTAACAKHFAAHSGPEETRHSFNAQVTEKDLRETYLYAFQKLVEANVEAVMCAYNRLNGTPCCSNTALLTDILRNEWKFKGHIVADCWALDDIYKGHNVVSSPEEVAAAVIKAGLNLDCSELLQKHVQAAIQKNLLTEKDVDRALLPLLRTLLRLGIFDPQEMQPYHHLDAAAIHHPDHVKLAKETALQSIVLLKNNRNILPLSQAQYKSIVLIGPNAAAVGPMLGNYHGLSSDVVTFAEGIAGYVLNGVIVQYEQGCNDTDTTHFGGIWAAGNADITIAFVGLSPVLEGEEHDAFLSPKGGDKAALSIPLPHLKLLQQLKKNNKPLVVVLTGGSALDVAAVEAYADAVLLAWYPGEQGGNALAEILFGQVSPSGSLPVTFYHSLADLPAYDNYSMRGRTYRYYSGPVQYPFGFGLSYTQFAYSWKQNLQPAYKRTDTISIAVNVTNTGAIKGDEIVQVYVHYPGEQNGLIKELRAFQRIQVEPGAGETAILKIPVSSLQKWDETKHAWYIPAGKYQLVAGRHSLDSKLVSTFEIK